MSFDTAQAAIMSEARGLNLGIEVVRDPADYERVFVSAKNAMPRASALFDFGTFGADQGECLARVRRWLATLEARPSPTEAAAMADRAFFEVAGGYADVQVMTDADGRAYSVEVRSDLLYLDAAMTLRPQRADDLIVVRIGPGWVRDFQMAVANARLDVGARGRWLQREPTSRTRKPWRFDCEHRPVVSPWELIHRAIDLQEAGMHDDPWS